MLFYLLKDHIFQVRQQKTEKAPDSATRLHIGRPADAPTLHKILARSELRERRHTELAVRNVIRQLRPLRSATITINGASQTLPPQIDPERQAIIDALSPGNPRH